METNSLSEEATNHASLATINFWKASSNALRSVIDPDGNWLTNHDQVTQVVVNYFKDSLGSQNISYRELSTCIEEIVQFRWTEECCQALQSPIGRKEVRRVLFSMDGGKAPGRDGYSVGFFKGAWTVVGEGFCDVVLHFFETNYFPQGELVRAYHLHRGKPRSTMKVDLQKAYDSVNWDFLFGLLIAIDDLMIFCTADNHSISFIKETIKRFGELSGLFANLAKSSIFLVGVNSSKASRLAANMGFSIGHLPVSYLGLPLLSGRLRSSDCDPLIQCITSRIRCWSARVLSFAGRLQLVRSVLRSLQVYWASVFMLPMKVHRDVDKILRAYLWRGKEEGRGGAKVVWDEVCLPFDEGGLAIRDGSSWNIASTLKILWLLLVKSGSL
ncbi:uncharacterized protein LOC116403921 [Cucumis sativus]|uniref:uncharacterized protein LOC116403921 n=1 Tax=Cucumis sativus TaxID=3659 RepID=UPI0012F48BA9|nr:uncharacterized protein LOC116403921 [Cucumis sativus]